MLRSKSASIIEVHVQNTKSTTDRHSPSATSTQTANPSSPNVALPTAYSAPPTTSFAHPIDAFVPHTVGVALLPSGSDPHAAVLSLTSSRSRL